MQVTIDKQPLTPPQKRVLDFVRKSIRASGYAPTAEEIAGHFGWKSRNAAVSHLRQLALKGHIVIHHYRARGITLVPRKAVVFHEKQHSTSTAGFE